MPFPIRFGIVAALSLAVACAQPLDLPARPDPDQRPVIGSLAPLARWGGETVTISGRHLGKVGESVRVVFANGLEISVHQEGPGERLTFPMPLRAGSGRVRVLTRAGEVESAETLVMLGADQLLEQSLGPVADVVPAPTHAFPIGDEKVVLRQGSMSSILRGRLQLRLIPNVILATRDGTLVRRSRCADGVRLDSQANAGTSAWNEGPCLPAVNAEAANADGRWIAVATGRSSLTLLRLEAHAVAERRDVALPASFEARRLTGLGPGRFAVLGKGTGDLDRVLLVDGGSGEVSPVLRQDQAGGWGCGAYGFAGSAAGLLAIDCNEGPVLLDTAGWPAPAARRLSSLGDRTLGALALSDDGQRLLGLGPRPLFWNLDKASALPFRALELGGASVVAADPRGLFVLAGKEFVAHVSQQDGEIVGFDETITFTTVALAGLGGATPKFVFTDTYLREFRRIPFDGTSTAAVGARGDAVLPFPEDCQVVGAVAATDDGAFALCDDALLRLRFADAPAQGTLEPLGRHRVVGSLSGTADGHHLVFAERLADQSHRLAVHATTSADLPLVLTRPLEAGTRLLRVAGPYLVLREGACDTAERCTGRILRFEATPAPALREAVAIDDWLGVQRWFVLGQFLFLERGDVVVSVDLETGQSRPSGFNAPTVGAPAVSRSQRRVWWVGTNPDALMSAPWNGSGFGVPDTRVLIPWTNPTSVLVSPQGDRVVLRDDMTARIAFVR